ncbi:hypothetical protein OG322_22715 [Streptomyces sp. NBC_01260]|uniref:hypothetical protein n=1 Tax=unclassified Streptomyces TaxID=2593676 RepID=UPI00288C06CB|nr:MULTISPECIES: hypothetical protein [unclassified Streptomyces]WNI31506.1 hypothetical protein RLT59_23965 [Streptomyces sp. ITFR-6]
MAISAATVLLGGVTASSTAQAATGAESVAVTSSNSGDITSSAEGRRALTEFASSVSGDAPQLAVRSAADLATDYRVLQVNMTQIRSQIAPGVKCVDAEGDTYVQDLLVAPRTVENIRYEVSADILQDPNYNPNVAESRCKADVFWDETAPEDVNDDPDVAARVAPYTQKYASDCFSRKAQYKSFLGDNVYFSYNDSCWSDYVTKYDGNSTWNYYSVKAPSSCHKNTATFLTSCGHGVERNAAKGPAVKWDDWAPAADSNGSCRDKSISVSVGPLSVGGSYTHCETQKIHKYAQNGQMSSYWAGKEEGTRATQHQVSVKVAQNAGRPRWTHWINSDACLPCTK